MRKVGLLGGVFDPVHLGHLHIGDGARRKLGLDVVYLIPAGDPPHKSQSPYAGAEHRLRMLRMAIAGNDGFRVMDIELKREGKSYTAETLAEIRDEFPDWKLYFIIGGDNLSEILDWKTPERIFELAEVVLVNRPNMQKNVGEVELPGDVTAVTLPELDISSSGIRDYIKEGIPCRYLLPPGVEEYIIENGLYR
ncbi:MAG: nicotinate-nucleotide adenylyltransferase [candidate division Zixibacteria bacterium]|nr:nicotinate-nucleotide adenylyltransferase [candidate division Zixibacteria bacterium]